MGKENAKKSKELIDESLKILKISEKKAKKFNYFNRVYYF